MRARAEKGLTLIETLVALAILAGVVLSVYVVLGQSTQFAATEQERLIAGVVADNEMIDLLIRPQPPSQGEEETTVGMAGRDWRVRRTVLAAGDDLLSIRVSVTRASDGQTLARIETLRSAQ